MGSSPLTSRRREKGAPAAIVRVLGPEDVSVVVLA
jgi:hypothetical protein